MPNRRCKSCVVQQLTSPGTYWRTYLELTMELLAWVHYMYIIWYLYRCYYIQESPKSLNILLRFTYGSFSKNVFFQNDTLLNKKQMRNNIICLNFISITQYWTTENQQNTEKKIKVWSKKCSLIYVIINIMSILLLSYKEL